LVWITGVSNFKVYRLMKKLYLLILATVLLSGAVIAQRKASKPDDTKYRINLPDYWGKHHKVRTTLIDKLPEICEELKEKDVCGDNCNPAWSVDFYITDAVIFDYSVMEKFTPVLSTNTQLNVMLEQRRMQNPIDFLRYNNQYISNTNKRTWKITTNYGFQCFLLLRDDTGKIITKLVLTDTNEVWSKEHNIIMNNVTTTTPQSYIENSYKKLAPFPKDLMEIAEQKILKL